MIDGWSMVLDGKSTQEGVRWRSDSFPGALLTQERRLPRNSRSWRATTTDGHFTYHHNPRDGAKWIAKNQPESR